MAQNDDTRRPMIIFTKYSPYYAVDCPGLTSSRRKALPLAPVTALCRCGHSKTKPYCDGSHVAAGGIRGEKEEDRWPDRVKDYAGAAITIHDNRGICSHDGSCINLLPQVFRMTERPWIDPDAATVDEIVEVIEKCPSGALSYSIDGIRHQDLERGPGIFVRAFGPLQITGGIILRDDGENRPECREHYCLCRCGASKNKPFCDGGHLEARFRDDGTGERR